MAVRAEYEVRKLPDTFVTKAPRLWFEEDEKGRKNRYGELPQKLHSDPEGEVQKGGWIILVRGKPGHSIRITSLEQASQHKLKVENGEIVPRLIDTQTGEEVNEQGIPLSVARELGLMRDARDRANAGGHVETDVDVHTSAEDEFASAALDPSDEKEYASGGEEHVASTIEKLEDE